MIITLIDDNQSFSELNQSHTHHNGASAQKMYIADVFVSFVCMSQLL